MFHKEFATKVLGSVFTPGFCKPECHFQPWTHLGGKNQLEQRNWEMQRFSFLFVDFSLMEFYIWYTMVYYMLYYCHSGVTVLATHDLKASSTQALGLARGGLGRKSSQAPSPPPRGTWGELSNVLFSLANHRAALRDLRLSWSKFDISMTPCCFLILTQLSWLVNISHVLFFSKSGTNCILTTWFTVKKMLVF